MGNEFYALRELIIEGVFEGKQRDEDYMHLDEYLALVVGIANEENQ